MKATPSPLRTSLGVGILVALAGLAPANPMSAQELPQQQEIPEEVQQMMQEFQELQQRFTELQNEVLQESQELQARQAQIGEMINEAMLEANPNAEEQMDRLAQLEQEAMAAQQAEDQQRMQELMMEAQGLQGELQAAQAEALEQEHVQEEIESFQDDLLTAMIALDPEAEAILERLQELADELDAGAPPAN